VLRTEIFGDAQDEEEEVTGVIMLLANDVG
jgi:hypothetical protein